MRPRDRGEMREYNDKCTAEFKALLEEFGVGPPRCYSGIGLGWIRPVRTMFKELVEAGWDKQLSQVKQKFCQLRVYLEQSTSMKREDGTWGPNDLAVIIDRAVLACDKLCEICGQTRKKQGVSVGWALCDDCGTREKSWEEREHE